MTLLFFSLRHYKKACNHGGPGATMVARLERDEGEGNMSRGRRRCGLGWRCLPPAAALDGHAARGLKWWRSPAGHRRLTQGENEVSSRTSAHCRRWLKLGKPATTCAAADGTSSSRIRWSRHRVLRKSKQLILEPSYKLDVICGVMESSRSSFYSGSTLYHANFLASNVDYTCTSSQTKSTLFFVEFWEASFTKAVESKPSSCKRIKNHSHTGRCSICENEDYPQSMPNHIYFNDDDEEYFFTVNNFVRTGSV
uniref:DUF3615 domain-containing protein n=1 Tax=Oryza punctata TaxID=4537 RepID=A0A0E0MJP0_ORYPU